MANITELKKLIDLATTTSDFWIARTMVIDSDIPQVIKVDFLRQITDKRLNCANRGQFLGSHL